MYPFRVFVTLEGPEGAGKSTVMKALASKLEGEGREVVTTREPGGGWLGPKLREVLLQGRALDRKAELLLFLADRAQHVADVIRPALERSALVLCDRYTDSTLAYQGFGRGIDLAQLRDWNAFATGGLQPDRTVLFDIAPDKGLSRISDKDRLDSEPLAFHQKVRSGFLQLASEDPGRWTVIDASDSLENVVATAYQAVINVRTGKA